MTQNLCKQETQRAKCEAGVGKGNNFTIQSRCECLLRCIMCSFLFSGEHKQAVLFLHGKKIQLSRPVVVPGNDRQVGNFFPGVMTEHTFTVHIIYNIAPNPTNWEWEQDM